MPSVATAVVINDSADSINVALNARFVLVAGSPSDTVYALRGRVPDGIDVVLQSDLVITVSGTMDRAPVDSRAIQSSAIARHLQNYFQVNGEQLGVRIASKIFVDDDDDGKVRLTLSPTRPVLERCSPFLRLSAIELVYACKTPRTHAPPQSDFVDAPEASPTADPFSPHGFLPLVAALDRIVDKFAVLHLVRKYPLIFGPWRERFDAEVAVSGKIARAVTDIVARSPHGAFRKRCHRLFKAMRKNAVRTSHAAAGSLRTLLSEAVGEEDKDELDDVGGDEGDYASSNNCDMLCHAMERLLQCQVKATLYKNSALAAVGQHSNKSLDDDFQLSDCLSASLTPLGHGLEDYSQDVRDRVELRFDEEADTMDGSQDPDVLFGGDPGLDDVALWASDEAESFRAISPLPEDVEDLWDSSQSTLDDPFTDRAECSLQPPQSSSTDTALSDPSPRFTDDIFSDEEEDGRLDDLTLTPDQVEDSLGPSSGALSQTSSWSPSSQDSGQGFFQLSHALDLSTRCRPNSPAPPHASHDPSSQALGPSVDEALEVTTSYFPIILDDDLACDLDEGMDSSRAFFTATPVLSTPMDWDAELLEFEFDGPAQGSLDGCCQSSLSSPRRSRRPLEPACVTAIRPYDGHSAASLRELTLPLSCSVSSAGEIPSTSALRVIDGDEQVEQHDGENEGSLVAEDAGHAAAIRARLAEEACAGEDGGGWFLAEPTDMVLQWEGFDEGGNEGDMLWSE